MVVGDDDDRPARDGFGVVRGRLGEGDGEDRRDRLGRRRGELAKDRPELVDVRRGMDVDASVEGPREGMELELEAGRDAEVRACPAQTPEQLRLLVRGRPDDAPVGRHELHGPKAVDRQPEPALEPADAATERQTGDARVTDDPHRADEPVLLGRDVELAQQRSAGGDERDAASGSTLTAFIRPRSMTRPPFVVEWPTAL